MTPLFNLILSIFNVCIGFYLTRQLDKYYFPNFKFISKLIERWIRQDKGHNRAIFTVLAQDEDGEPEGDFGIGGRKDLLSNALKVYFDRNPELVPFLKELLSEYESTESE